MTPENIATQLYTYFHQQREAASTLIQVLKDERQALADRKFGDIEEINQLKTEQTLLIETLIRKQTELLKLVGMNLSAEDLDQLTSQLPVAQAAELQKLRGELREALESCYQLNLINGSIIAANKQSAETALAILRGQVISESLTYSSSGQPIKDILTPPLSKA